MRLHSWDLKVKLDAVDDRPHVLVTGRMPEFQVHGWKYGGEAEGRSGWLKDLQRPGSACVLHAPQSELAPAG